MQHKKKPEKTNEDATLEKNLVGKLIAYNKDKAGYLYGGFFNANNLKEL